MHQHLTLSVADQTGATIIEGSMSFQRALWLANQAAPLSEELIEHALNASERWVEFNDCTKMLTVGWHCLQTLS